MPPSNLHLRYLHYAPAGASRSRRRRAVRRSGSPRRMASRRFKNSAIAEGKRCPLHRRLQAEYGFRIAVPRTRRRFWFSAVAVSLAYGALLVFLRGAPRIGGDAGIFLSVAARLLHGRPTLRGSLRQQGPALLLHGRGCASDRRLASPVPARCVLGRGFPRFRSRASSVRSG
jgi:hypothetical protein